MQQLDRALREAAGRAAVAARPDAGGGLDAADAALDHCHLLVAIELPRVLVAVAVVPDLVALGGDAPAHLGKRFDRVPGDEPGRADAALAQQIEQAGRPHPPAELTARQRVRRVGLEVGDPERHGVEVEAQANLDAGRHGTLRTR